MPEGLTNAPAAFQRFMNDIFANMIDIIVIIYLDDILIYSDNISEHKAHVREVLRRLRANGLFARADKCEFHVTSCEYLGYMLSPEGLTMAPYKVQIIQDWPEPRKSRMFNPSSVSPTSTVVSFSDTPKSQFRLRVLPARVPSGTFPMSCRSAFDALKKAFTTAPVLTHWIPDTQITVETDASDYALAAVLSITTPNGELHPIAFHSQTFSAPELNYDVHDKELLAIFEAFNDGDITRRLWTSDRCGHRSPELAIFFPRPKSSHVDKHDGPNIFPASPHHPLPSRKNSEPTRRTH